jgi:arginyl-tRNA synthetase
VEREIREALTEALDRLFPGAVETASVELETPREKGHGDFATNIAMTLARSLRRPPRVIAESVAAALGERDDLFAGVEVAGPGFINFRIAPARLCRGLETILAAGEAWGRSNAGAGRRVMVEFVSANPTGPLNVVNARAAAFGGALTRLLAAAGYESRSEFYVNDMGRQIDLLGASLLARYREAQGQGEARIPEGGYQGDYLKDVARELVPAEIDPLLAGGTEEERAAAMSRLAVDRVCTWQKRDLAAYGTTFDRWFRQSELYPGAVAQALAEMKQLGRVEERDGALWFVSTAFGDDQDRVLVRANGEPTYFLADLAYHVDKHGRGFERAIDIWGPDHHGYIGRMQAGMEALGYGRDWLEVIIVQQVNLLSGGQPVKMSKRRGEFITLQDLLEEVGRDTAIFFFLMRRSESHLDFDLDLAKQESDENPVFYVKYAHARVSGILRKAREEGAPSPEGARLELITEPQELDLIKVLLQMPTVVAGAAEAREPHRITNYLREVAQTFHLFYHHCRVMGPDAELTRARLALTGAARTVLANGLALMDIEAPERM